MKAMYHKTAIPVQGQVNLIHKNSPICELHDTDKSEINSFIFTRAVINISPFKKHLLSLPNEMWESENQVGNTKLVRPSHDAWGIKKIIFVFCDDFLQKVFNLPWSQLQEWRQFLLPIYDAVGINESQIVRCLLASMPSGSSIPVHHDTGYWVQKTHRLHLPIITGDGVDFLVGPTDDSLTKYILDEGRIIELNNQAKHAVYNNMPGKQSRVHLIFDYVEPDFTMPRRVYLTPEDKVNQTRRSIDLASEQGQRKSPSFIILGSQKCGTTSLYENLCNHPLVVPGGRRETHFFDWRWNKKLTNIDDQQDFYMKFFDKKTIDKNPSLMTGESTPSYMLHSDLVIPRISSLCSWAKLLIILRNPVDRAYSQYQMCVDPNGTPEQLAVRGMSSYLGKTFQQVVEEEMNELNKLNISPTSTYEEFQKKVLVNLPMTHGGHSILVRGLYALQIEPWLKSFQSNLKILSLSQLKGSLTEIQATMTDVYAFVGLPPHMLTVKEVAPKNSRNYIEMDSNVKAILENFYKPFNERLEQLLSEYNIELPSW